jgi:predicted CoA-substrate-specific enzyme activase
MKYFMGIDIGSSASKGVLIDETGAIVSRALLPSGLNFKESAERLKAELIAGYPPAKESQIFICATGYGRAQAAAQMTKTEIACHARAAWAEFPAGGTVVDIGGQDAKIISLGQDGKVLDFKMNRSCAAGTGSFLEELSRRAGLDLAALPRLAGESQNDLHLNSFCTVFAASELISLAREGAKVPDLVKDAYKAVVERVRELAPLRAPLIFSGGVIFYHPMIGELLAAGKDYTILKDAQFCGALGAALFARSGQNL